MSESKQTTGDGYFEIGKISRAYSFKGAVTATLKVMARDYLHLKHVFTKVNGQYVPYFIESATAPNGNKVRFKFEDINDELSAKKMAGSSIYTLEKDIAERDMQKSLWQELKNYQLVDPKLGSIGSITAINDATANIIITVESQQGEFLVPLHQDLIIEINQRNNMITIDLPEGLLNLNS